MLLLSIFGILEELVTIHPLQLMLDLYIALLAGLACVLEVKPTPCTHRAPTVHLPCVSSHVPCTGPVGVCLGWAAQHRPSTVELRCVLRRGA